MARILALIYGLVGYLVFFATFLYAIGFLGNLVVPKSIDSTPVGPLGEALLVNLSLLAVFAIQHSGMARRRSSDGGRSTCRGRSSGPRTCSSPASS